MMDNLIELTTPLFFVCIAYSLFVVYISFSKIKWALPIILIWTILQLLITATGFYEETMVLLPRFLLLIGPNALAILFLFYHKKGLKSEIKSMMKNSFGYNRFVF
jgi:hypothetical protein